MDIATVATSIAGALLGGTGIVAIVETFAKRRTRKVDATETLTGTAMEIVAALKEDAAAARKQAIEAQAEGERVRRDAITTHREILFIRDEVDKLTRKLRYLVDAIYDPTMTIHRLRSMVPYGASGLNGLEPPDPPSIEGRSS